MKKIIILLLFFQIAYNKEIIANEIKIGVVSDIHGNIQLFEKVLKKLIDERATHLILLGDYIIAPGFFHPKPVGPPDLEGIEDGLYQLNRVLKVMKEVPNFGIPKKNIYIVPGNWDFMYSRIRDKGRISIKNVLKKYGVFVDIPYFSSGGIEIDGLKVKVSHFPTHYIPGFALNSKQKFPQKFLIKAPRAPMQGP